MHTENVNTHIRRSLVVSHVIRIVRKLPRKAQNQPVIPFKKAAFSLEPCFRCLSLPPLLNFWDFLSWTLRLMLTSINSIWIFRGKHQTAHEVPPRSAATVKCNFHIHASVLPIKVLLLLILQVQDTSACLFYLQRIFTCNACNEVFLLPLPSLPAALSPAPLALTEEVHFKNGFQPLWKLDIIS